MAQPSLFFPYFDLMMQYCILLLIGSLRREMGLCEFIFFVKTNINDFSSSSSKQRGKG